jgi:hypothetical protein
MPIGAAIVGGSLGAAVIGSKAAKSAAGQQQKGTQSAIDEQRRQFDIILGLTQPGRAVGNQALNTLAQLFIPGFSGFGDSGVLSGAEGAPTSDSAAPIRGGIPGLFDAASLAADPRGGSFGGPEVLAGGTDAPVSANALSDIFSNLPGVQFLTDQARRGVEASGSAVGDPFGGNVQREIGFQTASLAENQVINRLLQLAGFGPQATGQAVSGSSAASGNISQLLASLGVSQAGGTLGQAGSINNALQGGLNNFLLASGLGLFGTNTTPGGGTVSIPGGQGGL